MPTIQHHYPAFCDMGEPEKVTIETTAELLDIPWVKSWKENPGFTFLHYTMKGTHLVAYVRDREVGLQWFVVGRFLDDPPSDLPRGMFS